MTIETPEIEFSGLTGMATRGGITVCVKVYRSAGTQDRWTLEVIDQKGWSTVWWETFKSDHEAMEAFVDAVIDGGGMGVFLEPPPTLH
jgi:hypothetical protein